MTGHSELLSISVRFAILHCSTTFLKDIVRSGKISAFSSLQGTRLIKGESFVAQSLLVVDGVHSFDDVTTVM